MLRHLLHDGGMQIVLEGPPQHAPLTCLGEKLVGGDGPVILKCCSNNAVKPLRAAYNQADKGSGAR